MEIVIGVLVGIIGVLSYVLFQARNRNKAIFLDKNLQIEELQGYIRRLKSDCHSRDGTIKALKEDVARLEAIKRNPTKDCLEMLQDLRTGGAILRIEVLDPDNMFLWSPGDQR